MASHLLSGLNTLPGIDLFVILLNKGRLSDDLQNAGIPTYVLDEGKQSFLEITWLVTKAVRSWAPHILHSHRYKENILSYLVSLTLRKGASLVSTQHGMPEFYNGGPRLLHRLKEHKKKKILPTPFFKNRGPPSAIKPTLIPNYCFSE